MLLYFVAHALYKAGLFMVAGAVDHEAGTRDITVLGGLADSMPVTFIAAALASLAMIGLFLVGCLSLAVAAGLGAALIEKPVAPAAALPGPPRAHD